MDTTLVTFNSSYGRVRRYYRNGREYFSAPMTLIVPGVLHGSKGPGYYSPEEVGKSPEIWNNVPIVVYHPTRNGEAVSASDPDIVPKHIGKLTQVAYRGKLIAIGEFDGEATKKVDPRVYEALNRGTPMELSTGLYTDSIPAPDGSVDPRTGRPYTWVAKGFKPDHLAILPDQNGACSIRDGCGMLVNQSCNCNKDSDMDERTKNVNYLTTNCSCMKKENGKDILNLLDDEQVKELKSSVENYLLYKSLVDNTIKEFKTLYPDAPSTLNEMPAFIKKKKGAKAPPEEEEEEDDMAEDEEVENKKKKCTTNSNKGKSDMTLQEWLATAPPEAKAIWNSAVEVENAERERLATVLAGNSASPEAAKAAKEVYLSMDIAKLRTLESALPKKVENKSTADDSTPPPFFFPGAVGGTTTNSDDADPDVLPIPTINWSDLAKAK